MSEAGLVPLGDNNVKNARGSLLLTFLPPLERAVPIIYVGRVGFTEPLRCYFSCFRRGSA